MSGTAFRAKQAAARLRISFSCSSRLFARFSRASSAASAFCRARASAEPAARRSLRHVLSWLAWTPRSAATCCRASPLSSSRLTASALYSAVNRRLRSCAILRSRCWWNLPYEGVHPARAGSLLFSLPEAETPSASNVRGARVGAHRRGPLDGVRLAVLGARDLAEAGRVCRADGRENSDQGAQEHGPPLRPDELIDRRHDEAGRERGQHEERNGFDIG